MINPLLFHLHNQNLWLLPQRCIFWEEEKAIIVSDLHFGKTGHFRKNGIAVPQNIFKEDIQCLIDCISFFKAEQVIAVGDLFHSHANKELDLFLKWRNDFTGLHIHLIKGNHDILEEEWYEKASIQVSSNQLQVGSFCFVHDITTLNNQLPITDYFFSGHIHPGIAIKGKSKQNLQFPCFYFGEKHAVLPAFSRFTGHVAMKPKKHDNFFAIVNGAVMAL